MGKGIASAVISGKIHDDPKYRAGEISARDHQLRFHVNVAQWIKKQDHPEGGEWKANVILVEAQGEFAGRWSKLKRGDRILVEGSLEKKSWFDENDLNDSREPRKKSLLFVRAQTLKKGSPDNFNHVVLLGRVGAPRSGELSPVDYKTFANGNSVARVSVAINVYNSGKKEEEACWIDVEIQGFHKEGRANRAETAAEHMSKGALVSFPRALLETQVWDNQRTGRKERKTVVKSFDWGFEGARVGGGDNSDDGVDYDYGAEDGYNYDDNPEHMANSGGGNRFDRATKQRDPNLRPDGLPRDPLANEPYNGPPGDEPKRGNPPPPAEFDDDIPF